MNYFTKEETERIISNATLGLCFNSSDNPNVEAMEALYQAVREHAGEPVFASALGFVLGRATGIREERARRKEVAI